VIGLSLGGGVHGLGTGADAKSVADSIVSKFIWYGLTETSGLDCADNQGNGSVGTITGTTTTLHDNLPWWTAGGNAGTANNDVSFLGDAYIDSIFTFADLGDGLILQVADWYTDGLTGGNTAISAWGLASSTDDLAFQITRRSIPPFLRTTFTVGTNDGGAGLKQLDSGVVTADTRHSVMAAVDGKNNTLRLWVDGTEVTPATDIAANLAAASTALDADMAANTGYHFFSHGGSAYLRVNDRAKNLFAMRLETHPGETVLAAIAQGFYDNENALPSVLRGM
jgi:hypothetical protein